MKKILIPLFLFSVAFIISAAPPILRQFGTTNTPTVLTNIIQSLAGGGSQVWTNDGTYIWLNGQNPPNPSGSAPGPNFLFNNNGSLFIGTNVAQDTTLTTLSRIKFPWIFSMVESNEPAIVSSFLASANSESYNYYGSIFSFVKADSTDPVSQIVMESKPNNSYVTQWSIQSDPSGSFGGTSLVLRTNNTIRFYADIEEVDTPKLVIIGTTNQVIFGSTNTAPVSEAAPTKWISVQVQGETVKYRLPLYQ